MHRSFLFISNVDFMVLYLIFTVAYVVKNNSGQLSLRVVSSISLYAFTKMSVIHDDEIFIN